MYDVDVTKVDKLPKVKADVSVCNWAAPTYGDTGETALHAVLSVVAFAVALWSAYEQMRIFNMRYQIAEGYADMAEEAWLRFDARYRPLEALMIGECLGVPAVTPDYEAVRSRDGGFADYGWERGRDVRSRELALGNFCLGPARLRSLEVSAAAFRDDLVNLGFREAEFNAIALDDMRFNNRSQLLNLGRHLLSQSASYGRTAAALLEGAAAMQARTTEGAMFLVGYLRHRAATDYPDWLSRSTSPGAIMGGFEDAWKLDKKV